jgi:hypothetical protein
VGFRKTPKSLRITWSRAEIRNQFLPYPLRTLFWEVILFSYVEWSKQGQVIEGKQLNIDTNIRVNTFFSLNPTALPMFSCEDVRTYKGRKVVLKEERKLDVLHPALPLRHMRTLPEHWRTINK